MTPPKCLGHVKWVIVIFPQPAQVKKINPTDRNKYLEKVCDFLASGSSINNLQSCIKTGKSALSVKVSKTSGEGRHGLPSLQFQRRSSAKLGGGDLAKPRRWRSAE